MQCADIHSQICEHTSSSLNEGDGIATIPFSSVMASDVSLSMLCIVLFLQCCTDVGVEIQRMLDYNLIHSI